MSFCALRLSGESGQISFLVVPGTVDSEVLEDLRRWVSFDPQSSTGDRSADLLLSAQGLLSVVAGGVIGNAAWSLFPAAAKWLQERRATNVDAGEIAAAMRACLTMLGEPGLCMDVDALHRQPDGSWIGEFASRRQRWRLEADSRGELVRVDRLKPQP